MRCLVLNAAKGTSKKLKEVQDGVLGAILICILVLIPFSTTTSN